MKDKLKTFIYSILAIIGILIILGFIGFEIYLYVHYGKMPISEVPAWVFWLMPRGRN